MSKCCLDFQPAISLLESQPGQITNCTKGTLKMHQPKRRGNLTIVTRVLLRLFAICSFNSLHDSLKMSTARQHVSLIWRHFWTCCCRARRFDHIFGFDSTTCPNFAESTAFLRSHIQEVFSRSWGHENKCVLSYLPKSNCFRWHCRRNINRQTFPKVFSNRRELLSSRRNLETCCCRGDDILKFQREEGKHVESPTNVVQSCRVNKISGNVVKPASIVVQSVTFLIIRGK